jgi:hypothetical protein
MKIARMLPGVVMLVSGAAAEAGDSVLTDQNDDSTSRMLQAYKKEQVSCGVVGRELECISAQFEFELAVEHPDARQETGCASGTDCETAPANFWGM